VVLAMAVGTCPPRRQPPPDPTVAAGRVRKLQVSKSRAVEMAAVGRMQLGALVGRKAAHGPKKKRRLPPPVD
jgi:hypothetical protein